MAFTPKTPTESSTITSQPLLSANTLITNENLTETTYSTDAHIPTTMEMTNEDLPPIEATAVTLQPLPNPTDAEKEKRYSQLNPATAPPERVDETDEACWFCIPLCDCLECLVDCGQVRCCGNIECCCDCCEGDCADCCGCFEACCSGDGATVVDGADLADAADCCGSCFECCSS
ncbi:hypothetical protein B5X24_HaOG210389 [Helicoverpa armigera]|uniref:Uncharacterized protein n=1 Tax=Helicoverpa armigera TaxID=29058 RepID=A0A2W1BC82_HELAM|nr:hypothetical protein B5X24_HaOG210389 [Helicoverpa armigera]